MTHTPTPEQQAIVDAARHTKDNLIIEALAGAAKTSTLVLIAQALSNTPILCLAFNKKIALEMAERLPSNVESMTLNALGHRALGSFLGKRLNLKIGGTRKKLLREAIETWPVAEEKEVLWAGYGDLVKAVEKGAASGYVPDGCFLETTPIMRDDDFFAQVETNFTEMEIGLIRRVSKDAITGALKGTIEFADQILIPAIFKPVSFPQYPLVMVDEAQDLSPLNHMILRKLAKKRLIAVGDACQAIYGFRGADTDSMNNLRDMFNMTKLQLSVSFRCPTSVADHVRWRAPNIQSPDWAKPGEVRQAQPWSVDDIEDGSAILCRNNAPLFSCAIRLLEAGRRPELVGNDLAASITKDMEKLGKADMAQAEVLLAIDKWEERTLKRSRANGGIQDKAACMRLFAGKGPTLGSALASAQALFNARGPISLMTGHKSKGLEWGTVYFLNQSLVRDEGQDNNLRYVMATRAKEKLIYINLEDMGA
jgi:hypothetical protein